MALTSFFGFGGTFSAHASAAALPKPDTELAADRDAKAGQTHTAIFAGGCFWCIEGVFRQLDGVNEVVSGYAGGSKATADYRTVCTGTTHHAEAVRITYDPSKITYGELLRVFFTLHDPTTKNQQGPDHGTQYRSAVFFLDADQKAVAESYIKQLGATKIFPRPIVTTLEPITPETFYPAEDYHQDYVACHVNNPYVAQVALPKVKKVRELFKDEVKPVQPKQSQKE